MELFDTHAHLNDPAFDSDLLDVLERARLSGVRKILVVGYDLPSSIKAVELSRKFPNSIFASVGVHPHDADDFEKSMISELEDLAKDNGVVAIGETGLDFYKLYSEKNSQREAFYAQLDLANRLQLPVILHVRKAFREVFDILKEIKPVKGGVFHCFSGGENEAKRALNDGFHISFSGSITFGSEKLEKALKILPYDRILIETDAPYLSPHPMRGKRNEPSHLRYIAIKISQILDIDRNALALTTYRNALLLFGIPQS
jgi:TatD DNase family protein